MPKQDDLAFIAERLRTVIDGERNIGNLLVTLRLLIREAIALGAFAGVRLVEFRDFFDVRHDSKPNHSGPLAMLAAMQWLAKYGDGIGLSMPKDVQPFEIPATGYPGRVVLRPHVELLAMLVEGKRLSRRKRAVKGDVGRPRIEGTKEQRDLQLWSEWQTAKDAGISAKQFCADQKPKISVGELNRIGDWIAKREMRGQL